MIDFRPAIQRMKLEWRILQIIVGGSALCVGLVAAASILIPSTIKKIDAPRLPNSTTVQQLIVTVPTNLPPRWAPNYRRMLLQWEGGMIKDGKRTNAPNYMVFQWRNGKWNYLFNTVSNRCVVTNMGGLFEPYRVVPQGMDGKPAIWEVNLPRPL